MSPDAGSGETSFTGERFLPECSGEIAYEHWHRYAFARSLVAGKTVLDVACGEGYGAALLSTVAAAVHGADRDTNTVRRAAHKYARGNLRFVQASCTALPFAGGSFDVIVSFETIEHVDGESQILMLEEFDRLLKPEGILILSSPNKAEYSDARATRNEFHVRELYRDELERLLERHFAATRWLSQRVQCWSGIWSEFATSQGIEALAIDDASVASYGSPQAMYYIVIAGRSEAALAIPLPRGSILTDRSDSVARRYDAAVGQLIEHYKLVDELTAASDRHSEHVLHLEGLVLEREQVIERLSLERDRALQQQACRIGELEAAVAEQITAVAAAHDQAVALQREVERLRRADLENQETIGSLHERVAQLVDSVREMHTWRSWIRFPIRRERRPPL
jgi:ubiquinone/menaquinone biosynthesis C-methylase UbiE